MSQIRKALERAKAEKCFHEVVERPLDKDVEKEEGVDEEICYTRTSVIDIPEDRLLRNRIVAMKEDDPATDQFKLLRTHVFQQTRSKGWNTIQVTGFGGSDGKSMVAVNLAISIAKDTRQTTLLADMDFRNPCVHRLLGLDPDVRGLKSHLLDGVPLNQLFISPGIKKLTVLAAGGRIPNATEILGSPRMEALVRELKQRYDDRYIILDTPGISVCPDPLVISEYVDAILLVARMDKTSQANIKTALDRLPREKILGIVANGVDPEEITG